MDKKGYGIKYSRIDMVHKSFSIDMIEPNQIFNFDIRAEGAGDLGANMLGIAVTVIVKKSNPEKELGRIVVAHSFEIENLSEIAIIVNNIIQSVPTDLDSLLKSVAISTTRGILYSECRGTHLHQAILPIIPLDALRPMPDERKKNEANPNPSSSTVQPPLS